jgi:hypothetical protein
MTHMLVSQHDSDDEGGVELHLLNVGQAGSSSVPTQQRQRGAGRTPATRQARQRQDAGGPRSRLLCCCCPCWTRPSCRRCARALLAGIVGATFGLVIHLYLVAQSASSTLASLRGEAALARAASPLAYSFRQGLPSVGCRDSEAFTVGPDVFLVLSCTKQDVVVYRWDGPSGAFVAHQALPEVQGSYDSAPFQLEGSQYVAFASADGNSSVWRWEGGGRLAQHQVLPVVKARDAEFTLLPGPGAWGMGGSAPAPVA